MQEIKRKNTRRIQLGNIPIGGGAPVSIQSMLSVKTSDRENAIQQIQELESVGCDIIRCAVMDLDDAKAIKDLKKIAQAPLVADIHFNYRLALAAMENGIDGLRINPGNIGKIEGVKALVASAKERKVPIRIGVNSGSLPKDLLQKYGVSAKAMVESALRHIRILEELSYYEIKVSVKASSIPLTLESYRLLSSVCDYPLHLGITEAGTVFRGSIKSSIALGILLDEGIGDTIRVSLTDKPVQEVKVAKEILTSLGLRKGLNIISCPTCGRTRIDLIKLANEVEKALEPYNNYPLTIAVMGCAVNGPGEAKEADFGIAGGIKEGLLFAEGKVLKKVPEAFLVNELVALVQDYISKH
ncbi:MAG: flavodoxin-dependent (E)-4-hydroxy-3-methylbut-2-enyl-diphosphate synthase [Candidatus Cloacimonadota bacterium]|jgi:(E)-4-hydroxy-3-methylbut-2-enyl-diphosphate synthase|nr:flavodoxin-dependent (E)-4-hydroxy-3-methylbut-2-enyl-diphosphate synthase [Candidatus Cloacimonas sp.]MDI9572703.1 flavodoxin-dependent (E)-4-hydroxy-3-methylbut-2-enyl-diphosphate synthase [Candidatus Cloacimonadota bacterium]HOE54497.1 flavodoxin-dependent (E)-4-hydroxy-3-methylbut-2-enyl-diphosphate synthase [Candidatus Cloacimonas acidaminovorans]HOM78523.1 flavodoxin-dependent (E)-4-hydroxy-3-methylbut-2-enyl-diphosphate synthase [Candidatus Cloacimonas acidaminovorans]HOS06703.1 flavo